MPTYPKAAAGMDRGRPADGRTSTWLISLTVLTLISTITTTGMCWLYGALALAGFFHLPKYLPETRGRSLEEIDAQLQGQAS